jgi:hypothetical protein
LSTAGPPGAHGDDDLDRLHLLGAALVAVVAVGAEPEDRVLLDQLVAETVEDLEHDLPGVERLRVGGGRAVAHAGPALIAEAGEVPFDLLGQLSPELEVDADRPLFRGLAAHVLPRGLVAHFRPTFLRCRMLLERHFGHERSLSSPRSTCSWYS